LLILKFLLGLVGALHLSAHATWSVLAVDTQTGQMVVASATCLRQSIFPQIGAKDLRDIQAVFVAGKGIAVAQSYVDTTRKNQRLIYDAMNESIAPDQILELLKSDKDFETRQFGILDMQGRRLGFSGLKNVAVALSQGGSVGGSIHYQIQGNMLASKEVIHAAAQSFERITGALTDRVMAAMEAADSNGGDRRCTDNRTAYVSYLLAIDGAGKETYISITDKEANNPIIGLRQAFNASRLNSRPRVLSR
jgi:uncharacterized Ntn-hydrolase superfamily protein